MWRGRVGRGLVAVRVVYRPRLNSTAQLGLAPQHGLLPWRTKVFCHVFHLCPLAEVACSSLLVPGPRGFCLTAALLLCVPCPQWRPATACLCRWRWRLAPPPRSGEAKFFVWRCVVLGPLLVMQSQPDPAVQEGAVLPSCPQSKLKTQSNIAEPTRSCASRRSCPSWWPQDGMPTPRSGASSWLFQAGSRLLCEAQTCPVVFH